MRTWTTSIRAILFFSMLTGFLFPLCITGVARLAFPELAEGSLLRKNGRIVGSKLLAQKLENPAYFWFRPSAADYSTIASGASNLSPASSKFVEAVAARKQRFGEAAPADLMTASGSGLDPDISLEAAEYQIPRVMKARGLQAPERRELQKLIEDHFEKKSFGILGLDRVHVLELNLDLDARYPLK